MLENLKSDIGSLIGTIKYRKGYEIALFRLIDCSDGQEKYIKRETFPYLLSESGSAFYPQSTQMFISREDITFYCQEYFKRVPEHCWCELKVI